MPRIDHHHIANWIAPGARVLDLGCEDGALLRHLRTRKQTRGIGVDIDNDQLITAMAADIGVIHTDIRRGLSLFTDHAFDDVILSQTLQNIDCPPQNLLRDMLRVGKTAIVSFPNFAHYPLRLQLLAGKMPKSDALPHHWHDTPNLRYCTLDAFRDWCTAQGFHITDQIFLSPNGPVKKFPNLRAQTAIYRLTTT